MKYTTYLQPKQTCVKQIKKHEQRSKIEKWFDKECESARKKLRQLSNQKHKLSQNTEHRQKYCETLKNYKQIIYKKKQQHYHQTSREMEESINQNQFWEK